MTSSLDDLRRIAQEQLEPRMCRVPRCSCLNTEPSIDLGYEERRLADALQRLIDAIERVSS